MAVPTWSVGEVLTASDVNSWFVPLAAYKTSATTRTTLTVTLDPDLQITLPAPNAVYEVHAGIGYNCSSGGINFNFPIPSGTNGIFEVNGDLPAAVQNNWNVPVAANSSTTGALLIKGLLAVGATTGTFGFAWASNSGPAALAVSAYSYLTARRVG